MMDFEPPKYLCPSNGRNVKVSFKSFPGMPLCCSVLQVARLFTKLWLHQSLHLTNTWSVLNLCVQVLSSSEVLKPVS